VKCANPTCYREARENSNFCCVFCHQQAFNATVARGVDPFYVDPAIGYAASLWESFASFESALDDKVESKVRKLLALANDAAATEPERDTARRMAEKLRAAHARKGRT
jgi:hypothetical protein